MVTGSRVSRGARLVAFVLLIHGASCYETFASSEYYSVGKVVPLPVVAIDAANSTSFEHFASHAYKKEIIFFQFEAQSSTLRWLDFAVNMAVQLTTNGYHHYVALGSSAADCKAFHDRYNYVTGEPPGHEAGLGPAAHEAQQGWPAASCAYDSEPLPEPGLDTHAMWAARFGFFARLVNAGINALMLDADVVLHADIYQGLKGPCLAPATMVIHREGDGGNAGFVYVQNAPRDGAAHWVLSAVAQRIKLFYDWKKVYPELEMPSATQDQPVLGDALFSAVRNTSRDGAMPWLYLIGRRDHPFWSEHPQDPVVEGLDFPRLPPPTRLGAGQCGLPGWAERNATLSGNPETAGWWNQFEALHKLAPAAADLWRIWRPAAAGPSAPHSASRASANRTEASKPRAAGAAHDAHDPQETQDTRDTQDTGDLPEEYLAWAPPWLSQLGDFASCGWDARAPSSAVTHLMGVKSIWADTAEEAREHSHVGRISYMMAYGVWHPKLNDQPAASKRLLALAQPVVDALARNNSSPVPLRRLIGRALRLAAASDRILVIPEIPCDSPWIGKAADGAPAYGPGCLGGVEDPRLIMWRSGHLGGAPAAPASGVPGGALSGGSTLGDYDLSKGDPGGAAAAAPAVTRCYVGAHRYQSCWAWQHVAHAFDPIVARRMRTAKAVAHLVDDGETPEAGETPKSQRAGPGEEAPTEDEDDGGGELIPDEHAGDDIVLAVVPSVFRGAAAVGGAAAKHIAEQCPGYLTERDRPPAPPPTASR